MMRPGRPRPRHVLPGRKRSLGVLRPGAGSRGAAALAALLILGGAALFAAHQKSAVHSGVAAGAATGGQQGVAGSGVGPPHGQPKGHGAPLARPPIHRDPIRYAHRRKRQMAAYSARHYGRRGWRLRDRKVIVLHFTAGPSYRSAWETFASNAPNRGELPGVCAHFVVEKDGRIQVLVKPSIRCRHTIGLNHLSIGVEMVQEGGRGSHWADRQILRRRSQIQPTLRLVAWLKQRFRIKMRDIIGHGMANDSPRFKDLEGWRNDHTDWLRRDVTTFRHRLRRLLDSA